LCEIKKVYQLQMQHYKAFAGSERKAGSGVLKFF